MITFTYEEDGQLIDPSSVVLASEDGTYGIKVVGGASVVAFETAMTRDSLGVYSYDFTPDVNQAYQYSVRWIISGVASYRVVFIPASTDNEDDLPVTAGYSNLSDLYQRFGRENVLDWVSFDNDDSPSVKGLRITDAIKQADEFIDGTLRAGCVVTVPVPMPYPQLIKHISCTLAGVYLYEARGSFDVDASGGQTQHRYHGQRSWAMNRLSGIANGTLDLLLRTGFYAAVSSEEDSACSSPSFGSGNG